MISADDAIISDFLQEITPMTSQKLKQQLFLKSYQASRLADEFEKVTLLPDRKRKIWAKENQEYLHDLLNSLEEDVALVLHDVEFDEESSHLSIEFVTNIRNTMNSIHAILFDSSLL